MSIKNVSEWKDQNNQDELFTAEKANEIRDFAKEVKDTNLGHKGNLSTVVFTADDWKDRPLGFKQMLHNESVGIPIKGWFFVEKVGNRDIFEGYTWVAYTSNSNNGKAYIGTNVFPSILNNGLPEWRELAFANNHPSLHTTSYSYTPSSGIGKLGDIVISTSNASTTYGRAWIKVTGLYDNDYWEPITNNRF